ncbi:SDR family NAD(P)-dependent oxidoreductase [Streptomyces polygonati]|uniref:SDR family NAD(P)-dependent oxidoreductase n=1 Tax=Streptomyces polygonati TaxID=1617087 RepID=A0ABV8HN37_9ACTN
MTTAPAPQQGPDDSQEEVIRLQRATIEGLEREKYEPIAIVGVGVRFPGDNNNLAQFEQFLRDSGDGIRPLPEDRFDLEAFAPFDEEDRGKIRTAGCGFIDGLDQFDAPFFNISPLEAQYVDPQQRLLLETAWESLENANINPASLRHGNGSVYIGASSIDYALELDSLPYEELDGHLASGITGFPMPGRLSYFFGMRGPSITTDAACASSLTALHMAVDGLRRGETDIALCGAVNSIHHPKILVMFSNGNMLAADGHCKTFDDSADGYARAEGCAMMVLKRQSDAERDGDTILALVRGTAIGQDGESAGLTVPNGTAQEAVIRASLANARLTPSDIQYVEAHGTGTPLGDPIEMGAITDVFTDSHTKENPIVVGSVKTNVGHMEPAAGMAGLLKTLLQLRSGTIFPHVGFKNPSGRIPWDSIPVKVPTENLPWEAPTRRAVINSFGFAGSIASVVLEQAPVRVPAPAEPEAPAADATADAADTADAATETPGHLFTLSAKSTKALRGQLERYRLFLDEHPEAGLADLCYTGNVARTHFTNQRIAGVVHDTEGLKRLLDGHLSDGEDATAHSTGSIRKTAFLFSGQGSQYAGMGKPLYRQYPEFRRQVDACDELFAPLLGLSIRAMMFGETEDAEEIHQTRYTQAALFTLEYALAKLWLSWGVRPSVMIGHSIGEVVAATVAGLFDLPDAIALVAARGRLMQSVTAPGGMSAVDAPADEVAPLLADYPDLAIAARNSPRQCVVSGGVESLAAVTKILVERGREVKPLPVSHAFHSPLMEEVFDDFRAALAQTAFHEPNLTVISNLTGKVAKFSEISDPEYWIRHIGEAVDFEAGMATVDRRGKHAFIEIGPSRALSALARQCVTPEDHVWVSSLRRNDDRGAVLSEAVAKLYTAGLPFSWDGFHAGRPGHLIDLPTYAFDRKRYWLPLKGRRHGLGGAVGAAGSAFHPLLGAEVSTEEQLKDGIREFSTRIGSTSPAYLADHVVMGRVVFPGTGYLETLLALQDAVHGDTRRPIQDVRILEPLFLEEDETTELRTRLTPGPQDTATVEIISRVPGRDSTIERRHSTAVLGARRESVDAPTETGQALLDAAGAVQEPRDVLSSDEVYAAYSDAGLEYGPEFARMRSVEVHGTDLAIGDLLGRTADALEHISPALVDAAAHAFAALVGDDSDSYLPVRFGWFRLFRKPRSQSLRVALRVGVPDAPGVDISLDLIATEDGQPVFELRGLGCKRVADSSTTARDSFFNEPRWLKRSLIAQTAQEDRHILVAQRPEADSADLVERATAAGARVSFAGTPQEAVSVLREQRITDVAWFWQSGDAAEETTAASLRAESESNYRDLLDLVASLGEGGFGRNQRLWLVTERAQWLPGDRAGTGEQHAASSLWGFGHTLLNEYPAYRVTMVDLPDDDLAPLLEEVLAPGTDEFQIAFRAGHRHVRRLMRTDGKGRPNGRGEGDFELVVKEYGQFSGVRIAPSEAVAPQGDEIQVRVHAAGLNFKDVLNVLGMLKEFGEQPLGFEAAGTVVATGPDAAHAVGDEVIINYLGCMKSSLTVPSAMAVRKPTTIDFTQAAGLASVYVTAYYALHHLAGMKAGDKVLIHAAAGGVGQAAVALAKAAGAEIYATASPHKWPLLRAQGVQHLMNSRTLDFADEIAAATGGTGVDIVLNSLNKDYIPAGMRSLGEGGRFVEMGKVGAWTPEQVHELRPDVVYHNFDLSELPQDEMFRLNTEIMGIIVDLVQSGELPPIKATAYSLDEIEEAFKVLGRGANIGKLVLNFEEEHAAKPAEITVDGDHTYLITGGLGALGLVTAEKLVHLGARHLTLISRSGTPAPDVAHLYTRLAERADVTLLTGDISDPDDLWQIMATLEHIPHPVGGIIHSAGTIADAPVSAQTWDSIDGVLRAKVYGSWMLHEAAAALPELKFFVGFSSAASVIGAPTQSNYAAGNAFLDHLMRWRASQDLPGLSVNWGPWGEVGMSARLGDQLIRRWADEGVKLFTPAKGVRALASVLGGPLAQVVIGDADWTKFSGARPLANAFYELVVRPEETTSRGIDLDALLIASRRERTATIDEFVRSKVAMVLHYEDAEAVDSVTEFVRLGLDSLVAVELKNALESALRLPLPASVAYDYPSASLLAEYLDLQLVPEPAV